MDGTSRIVLAIVCILALSAPMSQTYPSRPVRIVVPFAVGGPADVYARFLGQKLLEDLKQPIVVDNRPGAGSMVGTAEAAKASPDGHTLLRCRIPTPPTSCLSRKALQAHERLRAGCAGQLVGSGHGRAPSVPATSLQEFIALAKAKPGMLNYASSGTGTPYHMAGELFESMSGTDILHVPYKGSSGARNDVLSGQVMMMFDAITTMAGNVEANQVRALGTTGQSRSAVLPNVPTISEAGVPGYTATIWLGLMAPVGTPKAVVDQLNGAISRIVGSADVREAWQKQGAQPMVMTPVDFGKFLEGDIEKWARIVAISGAKPE